jgi:hypothetical protein
MMRLLSTREPNFKGALGVSAMSAARPKDTFFRTSSGNRLGGDKYLAAGFEFCR